MRGIFGLLMTAWSIRFRFRGGWWSWRIETAFGRGMPPRGEMPRAALRYGRWVHAMRRHF